MSQSAKVLRLKREPGRSGSLGDEALARACGAGDPEAIGQLFDRYQGRIGRYVSRLVPRDDVEDVVQTTFMQVARGRSTYDGRAAVSTWLLAIATNVARQHLRSRGRRRRLKTALAWSRPADHAASHHQNAEVRQRLRRARAALEALSPKLREAFVLCELEGLSAKETGQVLGVSEVAVWKRVSKARAALRAQVLEGER